jgi:hypothetical protein
MWMKTHKGPGVQALLICAVLVVLATVGFALALGPGRSHSARVEPEKNELPAIVQPVPGSDLHRLVLSAHAAARLGIRTERLQPGLIPATAVIYTNDGRSWTYTNPVPLTYIRAPVSIGAVRGDTAVLLSGPPPGTAVVTVGAAELSGVEYGVGGEQ